MLYLWLKVLHIISFVAWFAGIFYIWRLFVYHSETNSAEVKETLAVMERKLYKIIMQPAMVSTLIFGFALFGMQWHAYSRRGWIWAKIILVGLVLFQHYLSEHYRKRLAAGESFVSKKFRILNEFPTILLILIVILVVIRPF